MILEYLTWFTVLCVLIRFRNPYLVGTIIFKIMITFFQSHIRVTLLAFRWYQFPGLNVSNSISRDHVETDANRHEHYIDGFVQDGSKSSTLAMELLQLCIKPSTCNKRFRWNSSFISLKYSSFSWYYPEISDDNNHTFVVENAIWH